MQLVRLSEDGALFELPVFFSVLAHFTFGVTGALAGLRRGYDIIGVLFVAMITAIGGGLIRDGLLISRGPASVLTEGHTLLMVFGGALLALIFHRAFDRLGRVIAIVDALGLGAFAVYGTQRSLIAGLNLPAAILGGTITAVGGGLMRDILVRDEPLLLKPGQFYALAALGGCCLYVGLPYLRWVTPHQSANITIVAVFVVRMLAIQFNWRTTAMYREASPPPPQASAPSDRGDAG